MSHQVEETWSTADALIGNQIVCAQSEYDLEFFDTASLIDQADKIRSSSSVIVISSIPDSRSNWDSRDELKVTFPAPSRVRPNYFLAGSKAFLTQFRSSYDFDSIQMILEAAENLQSIDVQASSFIQNLRAQVTSYLIENDNIGAINVIFDEFDDKLIEGKTSLIRQVLKSIDASSFPENILVGILSVTNPWKDKLSPEREEFLENARAELKSRIGLERTNRILAGLS